MDMIYGISKSKDILLSSISEALNEKTKKAYVIDRLSDKLSCELDDNIECLWCNTVIDSSGESPVFIIDDSDVVKLLGSKFEDLGIVRDGSSKNKTYEKGYHVTEIVGLTKNKKQPISMFSKVHSSVSKEYVSANSITFEGLNRIITILQEKNKKGIFVNDRGYDNNEIFKYYFKQKQNFIIRLKENRKVYKDHKWYKITTIRDSRKGKVHMKLFFQGEEQVIYR